jgi:phosphotransferase system  glucose/maltose/N-acetylglucosamine-specific IIC component
VSAWTSGTGAPRRALGGAAAAKRVGCHPGDALRVVVGAAILAAAVSARAGRVGHLEADMARLVNDLPGGLFQPLAAVMLLGTLAAVPAVALAALAAQRVWLARDLATAGIIAWLLGGIVVREGGGVPVSSLAKYGPAAVRGRLVAMRMVGVGP